MTTTFELGARLSDKSNAISRNRGIAPDRFLSMLCREQLLAAVGRVADEGAVALKGSALVLLDDRISDWVRPSKDLDLHLHLDRLDDLRDLLDRAAAEVAGVGIRLEFGARKTLWRPDGEPGGEKVRVVAWLGRTRVNFEVDCWVGGERSPGMRLVERPSMLPGLPAVKMLTYPLEAMAADKLHAIVQFGSANTRIKDYYDLLCLSRADLDMRLLSVCIQTTFANNCRPIPSTPLTLPGLSREYALANQDAWIKLLVDAGRVDAAPAAFPYVVATVRAFANQAFSPAPAQEESRELEDWFGAPAPRPMAYA
ncbi:nucleotidyl transferase AbiEii/AbiGii toxin family protein [Aureimonas sp. SK2]|uniref:nucleotidyl transferase AbiEii/AbiGii toxin family protein n=1 Tax=Aureimonas sp. SK2 TaxID=3015992 RepID=UPI002444CFC2|nr:nucleotidyl transferase AbiEii/AbiGii toxin family protein [Aureimonas sp. SK2]